MSRIVYNNPNRGARVNSERRGKFDPIERDQIYAAIRRRLEVNLSDAAIALELGICDRTVMRYRHRHNIPNIYGDDRRQRSEAS